MEIHSEVRQAVMSFCDAWFKERNLERIVPFLAEEVSFVGTGLNEIANGKEEMIRYLGEDIRECPEAFQMETKVLHERQLS